MKKRLAVCVAIILAAFLIGVTDLWAPPAAPTVPATRNTDGSYNTKALFSPPRGCFTAPSPGDIAYSSPYGGPVMSPVLISSIGCQVDPEDAGESAVLDVQICIGTPAVCIAAGAAGAVLSAQITCGNSSTTGTLLASPFPIPAGSVIKAVVGTVTGDVTYLKWWTK